MVLFNADGDKEITISVFIPFFVPTASHPPNPHGNSAAANLVPLFGSDHKSEYRWSRPGPLPPNHAIGSWRALMQVATVPLQSAKCMLVVGCGHALYWTCGHTLTLS